MCPGNSREASVAGEKWVVGREVGDKTRRVGRRKIT